MKKLSKLSLLREVDFLSKEELKQLLGAAGGSVYCGQAKTRQECENLVGTCDCGQNGGNCYWIENVHIKACLCLNSNFPYGG